LEWCKDCPRHEVLGGLIDALRRDLKKRDLRIEHLNSQIAAMKQARLMNEAVDYPDKIYVIGAINHDFVKIGISADVEKRLKSLKNPTSHPDADIQNLRIFFQETIGFEARKFERFVHRQLRQFRAKGEWFRLAPEESIQAIKSLLREWKSV
jgi:nucleotidyltransferase/DNA polymerase involved in DNA repair